MEENLLNHLRKKKMLDNKDKIFSNLYGFEPWNLKGARLRGDWDNTKDLIIKGREFLTEQINGNHFFIKTGNTKLIF